jgi:hypothetical protein
LKRIEDAFNMWYYSRVAGHDAVWGLMMLVVSAFYPRDILRLTHSSIHVAPGHDLT